MVKTYQGVVVSNKMTKTAVVLIATQRVHPVYKKIQRRNKRFKIHVENEKLNIGDVVLFAETKPISHDKKYKFIKIVSKGLEE